MYVLFIFKVIDLSQFLFHSITHITLVNKRNCIILCILPRMINRFFNFGRSCGHENTHNAVRPGTHNQDGSSLPFQLYVV